MKIVRGERIGQTGKLSVGSSAIIFDIAREKILLTRRQDNGRWCLPGGRMEVGESISEACIREVGEETGLQVQLKRLIAIYSSPHMILEYADGNRYQIVSFSFEAEIHGGTLRLSNETTAYGYFTPAEIKELDIMEHHQQRIEDALKEETSLVVQ